MKKLYALIICTLFVNILSAQTTVSGFINANTNWTLAGSPYLVTGNALLSQGFTLTIDPGVVVKFGTNNALQIDGQLIAIGTPTQRITFTSNQPNPQPGDWAKLHFSDFCTDAVYDAQGNYVSGTIMKYCDVLYGGSLLWGSIDVQDCGPYFNHCNIRLGSWCGINFNGIRLRLDSSVIADLPKRGVYFQSGDYTFRNDTFIACAEGAIHGGGGGARSRITDSFFRWNYGVVSGGGNRLSVLNSTFVYNAGPAVLSLNGSDTVSCCKFRYNAAGPVIEFGATWDSGTVIHNNLIEYNVNNNPQSWNGCSVFYVTGYDKLYISDNTIRHNSSPGRACVFINTPSFAGAPNALQIYDNSFTENDGQSFLQLWGPQNNNPSFDFMNLDSNTFINSLCTYELYNSIPYGAPNCMVSNNYWGSSNTSFVDGRIYDYFDFANQSVVYYMPVLTQPITEDTTCKPFQLPMGTRDEVVSENMVSVFPNPTAGEFNVSFDKPVQGMIEVWNPLGEIVYTMKISGAASVPLKLPDASGVYLVRVLTQEGTSVSKIIKE